MLPLYRGPVLPSPEDLHRRSQQAAGAAQISGNDLRTAFLGQIVVRTAPPHFGYAAPPSTRRETFRRAAKR